MSNVKPPDIIKNLYNSSFFFSNELCNFCLGWGGNITNINKINSINRSAISIFCNKLPCYVPRILQFNEVYMLNCLYYFNKYMHDENFVVFHSHITSLIPNHVHATRFSSNINFTFPNFQKTLYQKQFLVNAINFFF